jgi:hypothetical protein
MSTLKLPKADGGATSVQVGCAAVQVAARALYATHSTTSNGISLTTILKLLCRLRRFFLLLSNIAEGLNKLERAARHIYSQN